MPPGSISARATLAAGALAATVAAIVSKHSLSYYKQQADTRFQTAIGEQVADITRWLLVQSQYQQSGRRRLGLHTTVIIWSAARRISTLLTMRSGPSGCMLAVAGYVRSALRSTSTFGRPVCKLRSVKARSMWSMRLGESVSYRRMLKSAAAVAAGEQADAQGNADVIRALNAAELNRSLAWRKEELVLPG